MNKLKFWRLERGLSQVELADVSGVPRHVVQLSEQGIRRPSADQQLALAEALGVALKDLFPNS